MNNKRKNNSLLSYFNKSTKSVVNSDRDEPQPAPSQLKDTETDLMTCSIARKYDIGLFVNCDLSDTDKNLILTNVWVPSETYIFPIIEKNKGRNLKFQHHWLKMFKWLAYSETRQGDEFDELIKFYLPECDINTVRAELKMWKIKLERTEKKPKSGLDAIKECNNIIYPNIFNLLSILCTLPVPTATPERMFSCLKRLKTYTRDTMKEERLNGLTLIAVYRNISITAEEVLDELAKKKRKLDLLI
ncbi:hypothetical protein QTP88_016255 [Uroleucon formosanum]